MTGARAGGGLRLLRGSSGIVTAGVVVLAIAVVVTQFLGRSRGFPGPGGLSVTVHIVAAVIAVLAQRVADHRRGVVAALGALAVFVIAGVVLWTQWWQ